MSINLGPKIGLSGRYTLEVLRAGEVTQRESFDNLITDWGLNRLGATSGYGTSFTGCCVVGSGNTPAMVSDLGLVNKLNTSASDSPSATYVYLGAGQNHGSKYTKVYTFPLGAVVGNVAEVGVADTNTSNLFSRALVVDSEGLPTVVTVLAEEMLRVTYELTVYPPLGDATGTFTLAGVTYNYTLRAAYVIDPRYWVPESAHNFSFGGPNFYAHGAALASITGSINNVAGAVGTLSPSVYTSGTLLRTYGISASISQGNLAGGIGGFAIFGSYHTGAGAWQAVWSPSIPKDGTNTLGISFQIQWGRV